jgi:hypothetical protein
VPSNPGERGRLAAFADFIAGSSLEEIARRYRLPIPAAEDNLRRALYDYGFIAHAVPWTGARTVHIGRRSS